MISCGAFPIVCTVLVQGSESSHAVHALLMSAVAATGAVVAVGAGLGSSSASYSDPQHTLPMVGMHCPTAAGARQRHTGHKGRLSFRPLMKEYKYTFTCWDKDFWRKRPTAQAGIDFSISVAEAKNPSCVDPSIGSIDRLAASKRQTL